MPTTSRHKHGTRTKCGWGSTCHGSPEHTTKVQQIWVCYQIKGSAFEANLEVARLLCYETHVYHGHGYRQRLCLSVRSPFVVPIVQAQISLAVLAPTRSLPKYLTLGKAINRGLFVLGSPPPSFFSDFDETLLFSNTAK